MSPGFQRFEKRRRTASGSRAQALLTQKGAEADVGDVVLVGARRGLRSGRRCGPVRLLSGGHTTFSTRDASQAPQDRLVDLLPPASLASRATAPPIFRSLESTGVGSFRISSTLRLAPSVNSSMFWKRRRMAVGTVGVARGLVHASSQDGDGRLDLARLAGGGDAADHLEHVGLGLVVVAPVAQDRDALDERPVDEFAQRGRDVGAGELQPFRDLLRRQWPVAHVKKRVDLRHGAVDAPDLAHLAPVDDEALDGGGKRQERSLQVFLS